MTIAESDGTRLAYITEVTIGTTPATPAFQILRFKSESLASAKQTTQSDEIRADKNVADLIATGFQVSGGIDGEFSDATFEDFMESVMRAAWATNVLTNGITAKTFTIEKTFEAGGTDAYTRFRGCHINEMTISGQSRQVINISFGIMGTGTDAAAAAIITGATYVAATTTAVMSAGTEVGTITVAGATLPAIKGFEIKIASSNREQLQIGSNDLAGLALGQCIVTGTLNLYFDSIDEYNLIFNHTSAAIVIPLGSTTGEKYTLNIPVAKLMSGDPIASGNGSDVSFDVEFQGQYDSGISGTIQITRNVA